MAKVLVFNEGEIMKKVFSIFLILSMVFAINSCKKEQTVTHLARYDYGFHQQDKAFLLLDGITPYFDFKDYQIQEILAGDLVTVTYLGEMYIQEIYPAFVEDKNLKITNVTIIPAEIIEFEIQTSTVDNNEEILLVPVDKKYNSYKLINDEVKNVVNQDLSFSLYTELPIKTKLFATVRLVDNEYKVYSLYSYQPR